MAAIVNIPTFTPADPANVTGMEWMAFVDTINFANGQLNIRLNVLPGAAPYAHPALPMAFTNNPGNPTARLAAATTTITHLHGPHIQLIMARHQVALALALAQQPQQQQQPLPPPPPAGPHIKATTPTKYNGKTFQAHTFIAECENYYTLMPMNNVQQICFTLQLIEGDGEGWKCNQLGLISQVIPPAHLTTWAAFIAEFNLRLADPEECKKAAALLNHRKVVQTTSVRNFIDLVQEKCDLAHYDNVGMRQDIIEAGLKLDLARAITGRTFAGYHDFICTLIATDNALQRL